MRRIWRALSARSAKSRWPCRRRSRGFQEIQKELIARNNLVSGMVYLEVTRGADTGRDFAFPKDVKPTLIMFTSVKDIVNAASAKSGIGVITVPDLRWTRRDIKSVALLAQVLAKQAAAEAGAGEAWMIEDGMVTEGESSSAFILTQDDVLVTRQNSSAILPGCTCKAVVTLAEERQLRVEERPFSVREALAAKEVFITSATVFVQGVVSIDGKTVANGKPGPMTARLHRRHVGGGRRPGQRPGHLDGVDPVHRAGGQQLVPDGPLAERRDRRALALAGGRGLPGDLAEERPDRRRGQPGDVAVVMGGEPDQVAAVGADRVPRLVRVRQVGEEVVDVTGERMPGQRVAGGPFRPRARSCLITGNRTVSARRRSRRWHLAMVGGIAR